MRRVISFDIDGTLEFGDPQGPITLAMVMRAQELGYIVGSASDRPVPVQKMLWERAGITVHFTTHKHNLDTVKAQFEADEYRHIGDTNMDELYAVMHGFEYLDVAKHFDEPWMLLDEVGGVRPDQSEGIAQASDLAAADATLPPEVIEAIAALPVAIVDVITNELKDDSTQSPEGARVLAQFRAERAKQAADEAGH